MSKKLDNYARNKLHHWFMENARLLKRREFDEHNHFLFYSVGGYPVIVLDMYSKKNGEYQGFEVLTEIGGNSLSEAIDNLEQLLD